MTLSSLSFVYLFLPCSILLYYLVSPRLRNGMLLLISLLFLGLYEVRVLPVLLVSVLMDYWLGWAMDHSFHFPLLRRLCLAVLVLKNLGTLFAASVICQSRGIALPLVVPVFTVTSLGYVVDIYRGDAQWESNLVDFALFQLLFFKLPAGPLLRYRDLAPQIKKRNPSLSGISDGIILFIQGFAKKVLLGNTMETLYNNMQAISMAEQTVLSSWLLTISLAFSVYFNLSAYCSMARGLGKIFSFEIPRNFYYPYQACSVRDFLGRFNMSVTSFFRSYVSRPVSSPLEAGIITVSNISLVTLLWGMWFGFRVNYIIWALYFIFFQLLEELGIGKALQKIPTFFTRIYTFAIVLLSFVIFSGNSVSQSMGYFTAMLGLGGTPIQNDAVMYVASSNYVLLLLGFLLCTSLSRLLLTRFGKRFPGSAALFGICLNVGLLTMATAFLLIGS